MVLPALVFEEATWLLNTAGIFSPAVRNAVFSNFLGILDILFLVALAQICFIQCNGRQDVQNKDREGKVHVMRRAGSQRTPGLGICGKTLICM